MNKTIKLFHGSPSSDYNFIAEAYLILPVKEISLRTSIMCKIVPYMASATIHEALKPEPDEEQRRMFQGLADKLRLRPFDPHEEAEMMMGLEKVDLEVAERRKNAYEAKVDNKCSSTDEEGISIDDDDDDDDEGEEEEDEENKEDASEKPDYGAVDVDREGKEPAIEWRRACYPRTKERPMEFRPKLMILGCGELEA